MSRNTMLGVYIQDLELFVTKYFKDFYILETIKLLDNVGSVQGNHSRPKGSIE